MAAGYSPGACGQQRYVGLERGSMGFDSGWLRVRWSKLL
jgi:hypothetical protein